MMTKDELRARLDGRRLTGSRNQCPTCGELFNSFSGFDQHRTGRIGTPSRRCMTSDEIVATGLALSADGFWRSPMPDAALRARQQVLARLESTIAPREVPTHVPAEKTAEIHAVNARGATEPLAAR